MESKTNSDVLSKPIFNRGVFDNPWSTWKMPNVGDLLRWKLFYKDNKNIPTDDENILDQNLPVHQITDNEIKKFCEENTSKSFKVIWIGHATVLINFQNTIILTDPLFTERYFLNLILF